MANKVFLNDQGIVECQVVGDQTVEGIQAMGEQIKTLIAELKKQHKPLLILDDITRIGQVPPEGRNQVIALVKDIPYDRLAMLGKSGLIRMGAGLIIRVSGRSHKLQYLTDRNKAINWLLATNR